MVAPEVREAWTNWLAANEYEEVEYFLRDFVYNKTAHLDGIGSITHLWDEGGPDSNQYYWNIAFKVDRTGDTFIFQGEWDSYEFMEPPSIYPAESYTVEKWRRVRS